MVIDTISYPEKKTIYHSILKTHVRDGATHQSYTFGFLIELINDVGGILDSGPKVEYCSPPVNICGDIRSRYGDLITHFKTKDALFEEKYLFLGNFIDGKRCSLETLVFLFCSKICHPEKFILLRGFLENNLLENDKRFIGEIRVKYPDSNQWKILSTELRKVFAKFPLCAIVNRKIVCLNSMFSKTVKNEKNSVLLKHGVSHGNTTSKVEVLFESMDSPVPVFGQKTGLTTKMIKEMLQSMEFSMIINSNNIITNGHAFDHDHHVLTITTGCNLSRSINNHGIMLAMNDHCMVTAKQLERCDMDGSEVECAIALRC